MNNQNKKFLEKDFPALLEQLSRDNSIKSFECCNRDFQNDVPRFRRSQSQIDKSRMNNNTKKLSQAMKCLCQVEVMLFGAVQTAIPLFKERMKEIESRSIPVPVREYENSIGQMESSLRRKKGEFADYQLKFKVYQKTFEKVLKDPFFLMGGGFSELDKTHRPFETKFRWWKQQFAEWPKSLLSLYHKSFLPDPDEFEYSPANGISMDRISDRSLKVLKALQMIAGVKKIQINSAYRSSRRPS